MVGGEGPIGAVVLRHLSAERWIQRIFLLGPVLPPVPFGRIRPLAAEESFDRLLVLPAAGAAVTVPPEVTRVVEVCRPGDLRRATKGLLLRTPAVVGTRTRELPAGALIWEEDLASLVALALAGSAEGEIEASLDPPSSANAGAILGWSPVHATTAAVLAHHAATTSRGLDRRIAAFLQIAGLASRLKQVEAIRGGKLHLHLEIIGRAGGDYALMIDGGRLRCWAGVPPRPDAVVTIGDHTLLDLLAMRLDPATAQLTGKVAIWGDPIAGPTVDALISAFVAIRRRPGLAQLPLRLAGRWFDRRGLEGAR